MTATDAPAATDTRQRLIDAATLAFAEHGVTGASLLEIARQAGQRNRGAVHYHFGSREQLLVAVLEQYAGFLSRRELELLEVAATTPDGELVPVVEAIVRPAVELAELGWRGRCYLVVVAQLAEADQEAMDPGVASALTHTGGYEVYALLAHRMPPLPEPVLVERLSLITSFVLRSVADRALAVQRGTGGRAQLDTTAFTANLVAMVAGMAAAPSA